MADSEISRTVSSITRENLHSVAAEFLQAKAVSSGASAADQSSDRNDDNIDPALAIWREWLTAHQEFVRLCRLQQRLETRLFRSVGFPRVKLPVPGQNGPIVATTDEEIDRWLNGTAFAEDRASAKAELSSQVEKWNAADRRLGYSRARMAEEAAANTAIGLAETLWETPSTSVDGAAAKLHAILAHGEPGLNNSDFPWEQIRSLLADLLKMSAGTCPR
ncbi:hypothetical protein [Rhizobium rhizogenes]|jgi:hypothetical protein|uniref:hypothetical protein n=1 Tax=Rhizobium rhizogenes TaxID=359 RepID=UPI000647BF6C|nr:hypothetical protein [Rhizobium rhizogenes]